MKLDEIYKQLSDYASQQEKLICRFPCDAEYNVPSWDNIYDALDSLDSIINYEPSDAELEAYNNSYSDPPHVVNQKMLEMKSESHGRKICMKHKEYQQKRAALDDAYLLGDISLSKYAEDSINLDFKYNQFMYEDENYRQYKEITSPSRNGLREVSFVPMKKHSKM